MMLKNLTTPTKWAGLILPVVVVTAVSLFSLLNVVVSVAAASEPGDWLYNLQQPALQLQQLGFARTTRTGQVDAQNHETPLGEGPGLELPTQTPTTAPTNTPTTTATSTPTTEPTATATAEPTATLNPPPTAQPLPPTAVMTPTSNDDDDSDDDDSDDDEDDEDHDDNDEDEGDDDDDDDNDDDDDDDD
jgi:hypothetical protein